MKNIFRALLFIVALFLIYIGIIGFKEIVEMSGVPIGYKFGYGLGSALSIAFGFFLLFLNKKKKAHRK